MSDDDLTIAYMLGVEAMRFRMQQQADEIIKLRAENDSLRQANIRPNYQLANDIERKEFDAKVRQEMQTLGIGK